MSNEDLAVVIAVENSGENVGAILEALNPIAHHAVHFMFGFVGSSMPLPSAARGLSNVESYKVSAGKRIPHIWAEGIQRAGSTHVGLLTGHFIPKPDWVDVALKLDWGDQRSGYGGTIINSPDARPMDWAIFVLRYCRFAPQINRGTVADVAADNAIYRRELIIHEAKLLDAGFWEPEFHRRFEQRGFTLALEPELVVEHCNRYDALEFARQRFDHATDFGKERADKKNMLWVVMMIIISPLLPIIFLVKILDVAIRKKHTRRHVLTSSMWIGWFLACWGAGELRGYLKSLKLRIFR